MNNADMPAMPTDYLSGLTKREHFAAMAMQGILGNAYWNEHGDYRPVDVAKCAAEYADALLAELERT